MNKTKCLIFFGSMVIIALMASANSCPCKRPENAPGKMGFALAIGLNEVDPGHYSGWSGKLSGCEPDAEDMKAIALSQGFTVETLLTKKATRSNLRDKLKCFSDKMKSGDLLVVSYSGHGGQVPDMNGDEEDDGLDETWCLFDGEFLDDELFELWTKFQPGVRILAFSDSCHSGTVLKMKKSDFEKKDPQRTDTIEKEWQQFKKQPKLDRARIVSILAASKEMRMRMKPVSRDMADKTFSVEDVNTKLVARSVSPLILASTYQSHKSFYDKLGQAAPKEDPTLLKASLILISGCEDNQTSADIGFNGLFTWMLKQVWQNGEFNGDHQKFYEDIKAKVVSEDSDQSPFLFTLGTIDEFIKQRPYMIE